MKIVALIVLSILAELALVAGCATSHLRAAPAQPAALPMMESYLHYTVADEPPRSFLFISRPPPMPFTVMSRAQAEVVIPPPPLEPVTVAMIYEIAITNARLQTSYDLLCWQDSDQFTVATNSDGSTDWIPFKVLNADRQYFRIIGAPNTF